jgi:sec-independent protein translocase protein TatB
MFGIGMPELLLILVVALIVVGPKKLPNLAKSLGKGLSEFRRATDEIKSSITETDTYKDITEIKSSIKDTVESMKPDELLDVDAVLEPRKPQEDLQGRKALMDDILKEHEEAHAAGDGSDQDQEQAKTGDRRSEAPPDQQKASTSQADA